MDLSFLMDATQTGEYRPETAVGILSREDL